MKILVKASLLPRDRKEVPHLIKRLERTCDDPKCLFGVKDYNFFKTYGYCHKCKKCEARTNRRSKWLAKQHLAIDGKKEPNCESWDVVDMQVRLCRTCDKCLDRKRTDLAGRCMAESKTATSVAAITLTYGKDKGSRSQYLDYRDIVLMMKRLRLKYKVRYLVAGEYGEKRGRAHWHILLFFYGESPELPPEETEQQHWPYYWADHKGDGTSEPIGYAFVQKPDYYGMLYCLWYAIKDDGSGRTTRNVKQSLKPPIGAFYWPELACQRIDQGLPFAREYTLEGANYSDGKRVRFFLSRASLREAWVAHCREWRKRGNRNAPPVKKEDRKALLRAIVPDEMRADINNGEYPRKGFTKMRVCERFVVIRLNTGDYIAIVEHSERDSWGRIWRVETIADLARCVRAKSKGKLAQKAIDLGVSRQGVNRLHSNKPELLNPWDETAIRRAKENWPLKP